ncbi:major facilitator superfamily MFS_1, partial [mine drainage metagenome]
YHSAIPVAFTLLILAALFLKDNSTRTREVVDFPGVLALAVGVVTLILGLSEGEYWGWSSIRIIGIFLVSIASILLFVLIEFRSKSPFISMKLMKIRNVFLSNFTGLFAMTGMFFLFYTVPTLLEDPEPAGFALSIVNTGLVMLPAAAVSMIFAPISAMITKRKGPKLTIMIGTVVLFASYLGLYFNRGTPAAITEDAAIMGIGLSFIFVGVINMLLISTPRNEAGASTGMNVVFRNIGSAIAPAIGGVIETTYVTKAIIGVAPNGAPIYFSFPSSTAFSYIYIIGMAFLAISVVFTLLMKKIVMNKPSVEGPAKTEDIMLEGHS